MFDPVKGRELLLLLSDVLNGLRIPFFLMQGTALGAYRDGGFCPTERDIDIGVLLEHLVPRWLELVQALSHHGLDAEIYSMLWRNEVYGMPRTVVVWGDGAKADIVGMMRHKEWRYTFGPFRPWDEREPPTTPDGPGGAFRRYALVHEARIIETHETLELFGREWLVPSPIEEYLEREYGPDWCVPADDSVSRTRVWGFLEREGLWVPNG